MTANQPATAAAPRLSPLALALAATAGAYGSLDSMLNVAFPDLIGDLGIAVVDIQWLVVAFVLASGGALIGAGRLGDLLGHHRTLSWGGLGSAVGMALCAAAPGLPVLVMGRVLQGLGTAFVMASAPALITASAGEGGRGRALGLFQMSAAVGLALGPLVASPLVAVLGWRSVFWVRAPVGLALGLLARRQARHIPTAGRASLGGPALLAATLATVLVAGAVFGLPVIEGRLLTRIVALTVILWGLDVQLGLGGQLSLGHGAFAGAGAYTAAVTMGVHGWPFPLALLAASYLV